MMLPMMRGRLIQKNQNFKINVNEVLDFYYAIYKFRFIIAKSPNNIVFSSCKWDVTCEFKFTNPLEPN